MGEVNFVSWLVSNTPSVQNMIFENIYYLIGINLPLFSTVVPAVTFVFQDRNTNVTAGTTVENKGKLILTEIFPSVQKHDI